MKEQLDQSVLNEQKVPKEAAAAALKHDLSLAGLVIKDILSTPEVLSAITDIFYTRYEEMYAARNAQPEIDFNTETHGR